MEEVIQYWSDHGTFPSATQLATLLKVERAEAAAKLKSLATRGWLLKPHTPRGNYRLKRWDTVIPIYSGTTAKLVTYLWVENQKDIITGKVAFGVQTPHATFLCRERGSKIAGKPIWLKIGNSFEVRHDGAVPEGTRKWGTQLQRILNVAL